MDQNIHSSKLYLSKYFDKERRIIFISYFAIGLLSLLLTLTTIILNDVNAQHENVTIDITKLTDNVFMLKGSGETLSFILDKMVFLW